MARTFRSESECCHPLSVLEFSVAFDDDLFQRVSALASRDKQFDVILVLRKRKVRKYLISISMKESRATQ